MEKIILFVFILLLVPIVHAEEEKCGLTNLAVCIPQKLFEFILGLINAPLQPFLSLTKTLLSEPVAVDIFIPLWAIIIYILSIFYGLFIVFAGFNFMISGYSAEKRERAKEWLKNIVLMVIFVQASYYLYEIVLELSSAMSAGIINTIDPNFFLLTVDNVTNLGLQLILAFPYLMTLLFTVILLALRYLLVAVGVLFFPIGLFLNFIPPLQSAGKLIINILMLVIFLPFIHSLMLLAASKLVDIPAFQNYKIVIMIAAFLLINVSMIFLVFYAVSKAAFSAMKSDVGKAVAFMAK
ncbi:MAG TPA: hypothetical protein VJJ52_05550 [Candidatus Nanoarchaeia archaeon]|nr:hypothetical protein [Candidatus Nanoarchaeia archaeon]